LQNIQWLFTLKGLQISWEILDGYFEEIVLELAANDNVEVRINHFSLDFQADYVF